MNNFKLILSFIMFFRTLNITGFYSTLLALTPFILFMLLYVL
jgi:hypothetical protein